MNRREELEFHLRKFAFDSAGEMLMNERLREGRNAGQINMGKLAWYERQRDRYSAAKMEERKRIMEMFEQG